MSQNTPIKEVSFIMTKAEFACYHFFLTSEFFYNQFIFLLNIAIVKSNNEIGRCSYQGMECPRLTRPNC